MGPRHVEQVLYNTVSDVHPALAVEYFFGMY